MHLTVQSAVESAVADAHRHEWGRVLAATARVTRNFDVAEECVQEAYANALESWGRSGVPRNPAAWLTTAAKRRAVDISRREQTLRAKLPLLVDTDGSQGAANGGDREDAAGSSMDSVADDRLRLIFTCCHPALAAEGQVALTLRLVCGVSTTDIARAFLVSEATMAARITRAKRKIALARIPYRVPRSAELPERLPPVLAVIHLLFTTGHTVPSGADLIRTDLVDEAVRLARMLRVLMPAEAEVRGLYALLLVTEARRATRLDGRGQIMRLQDQDRSRWDATAIAEARALIETALLAGPAGRYTLQAAIASLYAEAPSYDETDWRQITALYDQLFVVWPSPVVLLNRVVPVSKVWGAAVALEQIEQIEQMESDTRLAGYQYLPAVKGFLLAELGRADEAADAYRVALALTTNEAQREQLRREIALLSAETPRPVS